MDKKPNIILFLTDDLGYGDISCLNPEGKLDTRNIDRMASEGMVFTDAHSCSSVCTPSRYGIVTGRYNWRTRLKRGVIPGCAPALIEDGRMTIGSMLQSQGYKTAAIGKWHLGMDWETEPDFQLPRTIPEINPDRMGIKFDQPIKNGPNTKGFDYFFGTGGSLDQPPYVFIENDRARGTPTNWVGNKGFEPLYAGGILEMDYGPAVDDWDFQKAVSIVHDKVLEKVDEYAGGDQPFFIYAPSLAVHGPLLPDDEFIGKSGIGPYGDIVLQVDAFIGKLEEKLRTLGIADNTILIFTSDNGCAPIVDPHNMYKQVGHNPCHIFRGTKFDIWEGGHRVPLIIKWPGRIPAGKSCDQLVCLIDFFATFADIVGFAVPDEAAEDSVSNLSLWTGEVDKPVRGAVVHHSGFGKFSIRKGEWKLELCAGSGGVSSPMEGRDDLGGLPQQQLYNMNVDVRERDNIQHRHPEIIKELREILAGYIIAGRSTPGQDQKNTPAPMPWPGLEWMNLS